jgi:CBS domain containing-hemolysin-like protein
MNGSVGLPLLGAFALLLVDLALSAALLAVNMLSRVAVRRLSRNGKEGAEFFEELRSPHSTYRMAAQLGRQGSLLGASVLAGVASHRAGAPHPWLIGIGCGVLFGALLIETFAARSAAQRNPRATLRATVPLVRVVHFLGYPLIGPVAALLRKVSTIDEADDAEREEEQDQELDALLEVGEREGLLEPSEGRMMKGIVDLGETRVREIMTPRTDIDAFDAMQLVKDVRHELATASHSRFPVYRETIDNVVGILHSRDLFRAWEEGKEEAPISGFVRPALFVPETQLVSDLLEQMRVRTHVALVVDEFGGIAGLVTLEDLLEEIVGDIRDEHAVEEALVEPEGEGTYLVNGILHVEQLEELFGIDIGERDFDTVGGFVVSEFGRVPAPGEKLATRRLELEVLESDRRRVYRVRVRKVAPVGSVERAS